MGTNTGTDLPLPKPDFLSQSPVFTLREESRKEATRFSRGGRSLRGFVKQLFQVGRRSSASSDVPPIRGQPQFQGRPKSWSDSRVAPWSESEDAAFERVRRWSGTRSSSGEQVHQNHGAKGAPGDRPVLKTCASATRSDFSDALTIALEEVPNNNAGCSERQGATSEVESALSVCAGARPSAMLFAFASVESWGRSAGEKGTEHYGAGYHTAHLVAVVCKM